MREAEFVPKSERTFSLEPLLNEIKKIIVGQDYMVERILIGLLADGHILIEGVPGLAKTLTINTVAEALKVSFKRIQFTPDLLPADITGTLIYNQKTAEFIPKKGPIFANFVLADEINRAPSKVQSALLEAMQEKQITIGDTTYILPKPFLVLATQNPLDQEGTYPLPEAQLDRFMLKLKVEYPTKAEEKEILKRMVTGVKIAVESVFTPEDILKMRDEVNAIYMDEKLYDYIVEIVFATRFPANYRNLKELEDYIECGASPRASINLARAAKAHAYLQKRNFVIPDDIKAISKDILRHRIILSYEAEAEQLDSDMIIEKIFDEVEVP
ncbi:MAG: ATPase [Candidatus Cloacimonetes bacterium 4572_65]|nr:MAG: ATPase [Candidatus Cloacimonetes bacterium 4572_65]